jgi:3,4-dihydroxy 2-butanone 4-phosphate synthase/GTP cyclohydrolase II
MFCSLDEALEDFRRGRFLVLVDAQDREDEGDLITAAQFVTAEKVNLMLSEARGMFLFPARETLWRQLDIPLIQPRHGDAKTPRFGLPFDARHGISTGISAQDRAHTVRAALEPGAGPDDFAIPGHVLPLAACQGGLAQRQGHTEGAVELARRAGLLPAAVMSEVLTPGGQMARGQELQDFAARLGCRIVAIEQLL